MKIPAIVLALVLAASGDGTLSAHHSIGDIYDTGTLVRLAGVIADVNIMNPHVEVTLSARDSAGNVTSWTIEMAPPNALRRRGFDPASLEPGQRVTIESWLRRDGRREATGRTLVTAEGVRVDIGDSLNWSMTRPSK